MDSTSSPSPPPPLPPVIPPAARPAPPRKGRGWKIAVLLLALLLGLSLLLNFSQAMRGWFAATPKIHRMAGPQLEEMIVENNHALDKIVVVPIEGLISSDFLDGGSYSLVEYVRDQFDLAADDDRVKAVILKVNSPGGEVLASDDIYRVITTFQKKSGKPVIAAMGSLAASGGYYVSSPCRWIVANDLTLTGSIGVIMHSFNFRGLLDKVGVHPEVYKSGPYKDMLSGVKKESDITPQERQMIQQLVDDTFGKFKGVVAEGRRTANRWNKDNKDSKGRLLSPDWADYADGRVLSGKAAYDLGLVDELGDWEVAFKRAKTLARISNANLVEYQQRFNLSHLFRLFGKSDSTRIKVDLGLDPPRLKAGQLYFLSPTLVH